MHWYLPIYDWLIQAALLSLCVLLVGCAAVPLVRQPARRIRLIQLTMAGCLLAPWLGLIPGYPSLSFSWWPGAASSSSDTAKVDLAASPKMEEIAPFLMDGTTDETPVKDSSISTETSHANVNVPLWVVGAYLTGIGAMALWWMVGMVGLVRVLLSARRPANKRCREALRRLAGEGSDRVVLIASDRTEEAFTFAWFRQVIILPAKLCDDGDSQSLTWCLAHEWSHIRQRDTWSWLLASVARLVFFFQPILWWLRGQLRLCQDYVADALAAGQSSQPEDYAEFLTHNVFTSTSRTAIVGLGIGGQRSELYRRVVMLVQDRVALEDRCPRQCSLLMTVVAVTLVVVISALSDLPTASAAKRGDGPSDIGGEVDADENSAAQAPTGNAGQAVDADDLAKKLLDAERQAEATLKDLGAEIERNDGGEVISVWINNPQLRDAHLVHLENLNWTKTRSTRTAPYAWARSSFPALRLGPAVEVTDTGLKHLGRLTRLRTLSLRNGDNKRVTDAGMIHLKGLTNLEWLHLWGTRISDKGFEQLDGMTGLKFVWLADTDISDGALKRLSTRTDIELLNLAGTKVTDAGLEYLKGLTNLTALYLGYTDVTDAGLEHVIGLTNLKVLGLAATDITDDGARKLKEALPDCKILLLEENDRRRQVIAKIKANDRNKDGKITREEASGRLKRSFERIDTNGNDVIEKVELDKFFERARSPSTRG